MGAFLKWVGIIWAIIGVANIFLTKGGETMMGFSLIFNFVLFVLPGLILAGIGAGLQKKKAANDNTPSVSGASASERLAELEKIKDAIGPDEYERKKKDILAAL